MSARIRTLAPEDVPDVEAFLARHADVSLFLRSNLRLAGIEDTGERLSGRWVGAFDEAGALAGVVSHAWNGAAICCAPRHAVDLVRAALAASGRPLLGLIGPHTEVAAVRESLVTPAPTFDSRQDLFALALEDLRVPAPLADGTLTGRAASDEDLDVLVPWRVAYEQETMNRAHDPDAARTRMASHLGKDVVWVLARDGDLVATTAFNAQIPTCVQIGGVYTPPALRGRGYARAAVASHLLHARGRGVTGSVLFTDEDNEPARRCYLGLGYEHVGHYGLVFFEGFA